jgi:3-methyladenine DNA glycosylase Tag
MAADASIAADAEVLSELAGSFSPFLMKFKHSFQEESHSHTATTILTATDSHPR